MSQFIDDDPTQRFEVDRKKSKVEEYCSRKQNVFSTEQLHIHLSNAENVKDDSCKMSLSKSLVGGSTNVCKRRVLNFQGNGFSCVPTRMIMSEQPNDSTVAMHIGEILEEVQYTATLEDYLPTLPNTHFADLVAAQFCSLMVREGYVVEDHVQPRPISMNGASSNQTNMPPNGSVAEGVSGQLSNELARPSTSINSSVNTTADLSRTPDWGFNAFYTSTIIPSAAAAAATVTMLASNPLAHLNTVGQNSMHLGNQMANKPSPVQLQLLQSQQLQSQHPQMK